MESQVSQENGKLLLHSKYVTKKYPAPNTDHVVLKKGCIYATGNGNLQSPVVDSCDNLTFIMCHSSLYQRRMEKRFC